VSAAKASWSTSAQLAAGQKVKETARRAEELVPVYYHRFLKILEKKESMRLPPRRQYDFRVDLIPGAQPQAGRIILLSPTENTTLDTLIRDGLNNGTRKRSWAH
jgi:hypothetical protein